MENIHSLRKLSDKIDVLATKQDIEPIKQKLDDLHLRFVVVEDRVNTLWQDKMAPARSPRQLNEYGNNILVKSGIKEVVDEHRQEFVNKIKTMNINNAYDCEQAILDLA